MTEASTSQEVAAFLDGLTLDVGGRVLAAALRRVALTLDSGKGSAAAVAALTRSMTSLMSELAGAAAPVPDALDELNARRAARRAAG